MAKYSFTRWNLVDGCLTKMAEGVGINKASNFNEAVQAAWRLASRDTKLIVFDQSAEIARYEALEKAVEDLMNAFDNQGLLSGRFASLRAALKAVKQ